MTPRSRRSAAIAAMAGCFFSGSAPASAPRSSGKIMFSHWNWAICPTSRRASSRMTSAKTGWRGLGKRNGSARTDRAIDNCGCRRLRGRLHRAPEGSPNEPKKDRHNPQCLPVPRLRETRPTAKRQAQIQVQEFPTTDETRTPVTGTPVRPWSNLGKLLRKANRYACGNTSTFSGSSWKRGSRGPIAPAPARSPFSGRRRGLICARPFRC